MIHRTSCHTKEVTLLLTSSIFLMIFAEPPECQNSWWRQSYLMGIISLPLPPVKKRGNQYDNNGWRPCPYTKLQYTYRRPWFLELARRVHCCEKYELLPHYYFFFMTEVHKLLYTHSKVRGDPARNLWRKKLDTLLSCSRFFA